MLYYKQFLDKSCDSQKNCWLDDDYIVEEVCVLSALLILYILVFEVRNICSRTQLCVHCSLYILRF